MKSAGAFYDDVSKNLGPILSEFADVMPDGARESLNRVNALVQDRRADLETACKVCKGEVKAAIKDVSSRMGIEGKIREALVPLERLAPAWLVTSPAAQMVVGVAAVLVGGGSIAAVGGAMVTASSGGDSGDSGTVAPNGTGGSGSGTNSTLPDACDLLTAADAESVMGEEVVQQEGAECVYWPVTDPNGIQGCPRVSIAVFRNNPPTSGPDVEEEPGLGDFAYWHPSNRLEVYVGDVGFAVSAWLKGPGDCGVTGDELLSWRDEWRTLAKAAVARLE
jgi:hypothetical protein